MELDLSFILLTLLFFGQPFLKKVIFSDETIEDKIVVSAFGKNLLLDSLCSRIPDELSFEDSTLLSERIIEGWVRENVLLAQAEKNINEFSSSFESSIRSYRNALLVTKFEREFIASRVDTKVQDAYSLRSTPQVIGSAIDYIDYCQKQVEIELNGVGDNPIFFVNEKIQLSGANFQGTPVSLPLDNLGAAVTMVSVLSERRMNRLNNPALSNGLPAFLTKGGGMFSGLMLSQYTADMLIVEQRILSAPASIQSIPAAADQEDFVSMGMNTAIKNFQILASIILLEPAQPVKVMEISLVLTKI